MYVQIFYREVLADHGSSNSTAEKQYRFGEIGNEAVLEESKDGCFAPNKSPRQVGDMGQVYPERHQSAISKRIHVMLEKVAELDENLSRVIKKN